MWSRIRGVMMWLLMAALPMQSWAAATMVNCGPTHSRMAGHAVAAAEPGHAHDTHGHDAHPGSHAHPHANAGHDPASHPHGMAADGQADPSGSDADVPQPPLGKFKCSACATCCLGVVLPSPILIFDASESSDTVALGMPQGHVDFLTEGLERPPRPLLA